ncbi:MAG: hypothetical protein QG623_116 [Patescibacteria group bacterium]|nr:hypothetical protein [Patescibacteria group bacterium]
MKKNIVARLNQNEKIISVIASSLGVLASLSFFEIISSNLNGNSNIYIQPIIIGINAAFWSLHAFIKRDWALFIPNLLAIVLATVATATAIM